MAGYRGSWVGIVDPKHAEALAFKEALPWLNKKKLSCVHLELDSLGVVLAFKGKEMDSSYMGAIIKECRTIFKELRSCSVYYERRSPNSVAHAFARETISISECKEWCDAPFFLISVLNSIL